MQKIVVTGPWKVQTGEAEDHIVIDAKISEWKQMFSPGGQEPVTKKIKPKPIDDEFYFAIQPDGTLKRALITFTGEGLIPSMPIKAQAIAVNLTKQKAQE